MAYITAALVDAGPLSILKPTLQYSKKEHCNAVNFPTPSGFQQGRTPRRWMLLSAWLWCVFLCDVCVFVSGPLGVSLWTLVPKRASFGGENEKPRSTWRGRHSDWPRLTPSTREMRKGIFSLQLPCSPALYPACEALPHSPQKRELCLESPPETVFAATWKSWPSNHLIGAAFVGPQAQQSTLFTTNQNQQPLSHAKGW